MTAIRIAGPSVEPLTVSEAKAQVRISHSIEDALIARYIKTARIEAENRTQRTLITTTWRMTLDAFPKAIRLPFPRVQSVESLSFIDADGVPQVLHPDDYIVDTVGEPGWIVPGVGKAWPDTQYRINAVVADYKAGYGDGTESVPEPLVSWIALAVGDLCSQRTLSSDKAVVPVQFFDSFLDEYKVYG